MKLIIALLGSFETLIPKFMLEYKMSNFLPVDEQIDLP